MSPVCWLSASPAFDTFKVYKATAADGAQLEALALNSFNYNIFPVLEMCENHMYLTVRCKHLTFKTILAIYQALKLYWNTKCTVLGKLSTMVFNIEALQRIEKE